MRLGNEKRSEHINAWVDKATMQWLIDESEKRNWKLSQTIHWYLSKCAKASSSNRTYMSHELQNHEKSSSAVTVEPCIQQLS